MDRGARRRRSHRRLHLRKGGDVTFELHSADHPGGQCGRCIHDVDDGPTGSAFEPLRGLDDHRADQRHRAVDNRRDRGDGNVCAETRATDDHTHDGASDHDPADRTAGQQLIAG